MAEQLPTDEILQRAAALWGRAIRSGGWDNGDDSDRAGFAVAMVALNRDAAMRTSNASKEAMVVAFEAALVLALKANRDAAAAEPGKVWFRSIIGCDYSPDEILGRACEVSGLPAILLPCKSTVYLNHDHVGSRFGYGGQHLNHYPLGGGRWLLTTLSGEDMPIVIRAVQEGRLPELQVER
jgi:hypothetical protein